MTIVKLVNQSIECLNYKEEYINHARRVEEYARICFQSSGSSNNQKFVKHILENQHGSVLEHFNLSFKIVTDRAIANALVRHRHCAFTQESTHYIDYIKKQIPLEVVAPANLTSADLEVFGQDMHHLLQIYERQYTLYGKDRARKFLPLGLKTELRITTNIREWRHIIKLRGAFDHPDMLELINLLYDWFLKELPIFIEDITIKGVV